jgi:hypothetical protein
VVKFSFLRDTKDNVKMVIHSVLLHTPEKRLKMLLMPYCARRKLLAEPSEGSEEINEN